MKHLLIVGIGLVVLTLGMRPTPILAETTTSAPPSPLAGLPPENMGCLSCHSLEGQAARTTPLETRQRNRLSGNIIDIGKLARSVHVELACIDCHGDGADVIPHRKGFAEGVKSCPACHRRHNAAIVPEFEKSVHALRAPGRFTCASCHDPHAMRKAASLGPERKVAARDNAMCLDCHNSDERYAAFTDKKRPSLLATHAWQPNPLLHWSAVRCIDCHTPEKADGAIAHNILPREQAARLCVDCHSTNSSLLTRLYRHEVQEQRVNAAGFVNAYILTQAYVLGVTRNAYLDEASLIGLAALLGLLAGHGLLRWITRSKRQGRQ